MFWEGRGLAPIDPPVLPNEKNHALSSSKLRETKGYFDFSKPTLSKVSLCIIILFIDSSSSLGAVHCRVIQRLKTSICFCCCIIPSTDFTSIPSDNMLFANVNLCLALLQLAFLVVIKLSNSSILVIFRKNSIAFLSLFLLFIIRLFPKTYLNTAALGHILRLKGRLLLHPIKLQSLTEHNKI